MRRVFILLILVITVGCARVPLEVKTAMEKQAAELKQIKTSYKSSVDALFAQIRILQLYILAEKEKEFQQRYARGPQEIEAGKKKVVIYTDDAGKGLPPSGNPNVDLIALSTSRQISEWFATRRTETEEQLARLKEEFLKLEDHIEVAEQINQAVTEYVDSLVNLRKEQEELGNSLVKRVSALPFAASIQNNLISLLLPNTEDLEKKIK